jgi:hypothetical protein
MRDTEDKSNGESNNGIDASEEIDCEVYNQSPHIHNILIKAESPS